MLFEMLPGYHTQNFVSEIYRLTENVSKQIETNSGSRAFDWLDKYKSSGELVLTVNILEYLRLPYHVSVDKQDSSYHRQNTLTVCFRRRF